MVTGALFPEAACICPQLYSLRLACKVVMERHEACTMIQLAVTQFGHQGRVAISQSRGSDVKGFLARDNLCASQPLATVLSGKEWEAREEEHVPASLPRSLLLPAIASALHPVYTD